ncbi:kallikrein-11, partial [Sigmodon hispidus]
RVPRTWACKVEPDCEAPGRDKSVLTVEPHKVLGLKTEVSSSACITQITQWAFHAVQVCLPFTWCLPWAPWIPSQPQQWQSLVSRGTWMGYHKQAMGGGKLRSLKCSLLKWLETHFPESLLVSKVILEAPCTQLMLSPSGAARFSDPFLLLPITMSMAVRWALEGRHPWQVALFQKTRLLCGATLIHPKWLLTAAHCRKPQYVILLGEHNLEKTDGYEQKRTATESFPHPGFNNSLPNKDHRNDIMLVKMSSPAILTRAVQPLSLSSHCVTAGTSCLISGWGTTSSPQLRLPHSLRCANVSIIEHKECESAYPGNITETMLCASVRKEGKDSCQGDSGGPLVCNRSLQGIISWGQDPCAVTRKPGVYTKVCKYIDWIHEIMRNN